MQASELFKQSNTVLLDGGMGTMLQASGLKLGAKPEELNITNPELIESIHAKYAAAGSRIVNANTFGASAHKLAGSAYSLEEIIAAGIANCKRACAPYGALTALDVGPLGELLRLTRNTDLCTPVHFDFNHEHIVVEKKQDNADRFQIKCYF